MTTRWKSRSERSSAMRDVRYVDGKVGCGEHSGEVISLGDLQSADEGGHGHSARNWTTSLWSMPVRKSAAPSVGGGGKVEVLDNMPDKGVAKFFGVLCGWMLLEARKLY